MTLRARLLLVVGVLLAASLVVTGGLVVGLTRANLVDQLDEDLRGASLTDVSLLQPNQGPADPFGRRFALLLLDPDGVLIGSLASGPRQSPDPLPALPAAGETALPIGRVVWTTSSDGALSYRVLARPAPQRPVVLVDDERVATVVFGAPASSVDRSVGALVRTLVLVGLIVLALVLIIGWVIIRRNLRPLEQMTATAARISAGDLSQRVGVPDDGSEVGRLGNAFDVMLDQIEGAFDSQREALRAKEASEQMLRQFVADASHELRTPLTTVRGYAELHSAGGLGEAEDLEQAMARIGSESRRMGTLVEDLLLLARLDQGRPLRQDPVAFSTLVEDALKDMRALEPDRPITTDLAPGLTITGDEDRLRQLVGNLMTNVRVHTPPNSALEVALAEGAESVVLKVADHGPGIDPEHSKHIFDRFYRADSARSRDRGGSGLGLAIAASVAVAHGGSLEHSATPGGGATFTLTLPRG